MPLHGFIVYNELNNPDLTALFAISASTPWKAA
jgi:predicted NAD/FAD-binding protein